MTHLSKIVNCANNLSAELVEGTITSAKSCKCAEKQADS